MVFPPEEQNLVIPRAPRSILRWVLPGWWKKKIKPTLKAVWSNQTNLKVSFKIMKIFPGYISYGTRSRILFKYKTQTKQKSQCLAPNENYQDFS